MTNLFETWNAHIRCCAWNAPLTLSSLCQPVDIMMMITTNTTWWEDDDNIYDTVPLTCLVISGHGLLVSINSILLYQTLISITKSFIYMFQLKSSIFFFSCEWAVHTSYTFQHTSWFLLLHFLDFDSEHILLCKSKVAFMNIIIIIIIIII
jgi:hypothetical protein